MVNIKSHILYLCPKCGSMKIDGRCDFDPLKSIFVIIDCPECEDMKSTGNFMHYYGKNGYLGDEDRNNSLN